MEAWERSMTNAPQKYIGGHGYMGCLGKASTTLLEDKGREYLIHYQDLRVPEIKTIFPNSSRDITFLSSIHLFSIRADTRRRRLEKGVRVIALSSEPAQICSIFHDSRMELAIQRAS